MPVTRRHWALGAIGLASAAELVSAFQHAHQAARAASPPKLDHLDPAAARKIEAITSRIIPSDGTPGAREAGVIYFIDRALGTWEADKLPAYRKGIDELERTRARMFPASASLQTLSDDQMDRLITSIEGSEFFELLRAHTVLGFLGSPDHGGNRGGVGWTHLGVEDRMVFEPPFGYYDGEASQ